MTNTKYQYQQLQPKEPKEGWGHIETNAERQQRQTAYAKATEAARKKMEMERMIRLCTAISSSIIYMQQEIENEKKREKDVRGHQAKNKSINAGQKTYGNT